MDKLPENWEELENNSLENESKQWKGINAVVETTRTNAEIINSSDISKEKLEAINNNLSEQQKNTIWLEILSLESMTVEKITVIGYMLSAEDINDIWLEKLAKIDMDELNELTKKYM